MKRVLEYIRTYGKKIFLNKYLIVVLVFVVLFFFLGDQNIFSFFSRQIQIHRMNKELQEYHRSTAQYQRELERLQDIDSLEMFAREHYLMKSNDEVIYLVDE